MVRLVRVLLIDDDLEMQEIVGDVLKRTVDIELIGTGSNGQDALTMCRQLCPDVMLLDVMMPVMDGIEAAHLLHVQCPDVKILVLSSIQDHESVHAMLKNGADGYINKSKLVHDLAESIRATYHGKKVFSSEAFSHLAQVPNKSTGRNFDLTMREKEILCLLAAGLSKPRIALKLGIQDSTVKFHFENICNKLGVRTRSEALIVAAKNKLV